MTPVDYDVAILGAGAAGLAAAAELSAAGKHSVLVLEARDRIGGRMWTVREPGLPIPLELGAEFIHGRATATFDVLSAGGVSAIDATESHWMRSGNGLTRMNEALFKEIRQALVRSGVARRKDVPFAELLANAGRYGLSPKGKRFAQMMVEGFDAADPALVSARSIAEEWRSGGATDAPQFRPAGGYGAVVNALARRLGGNARLQLRSVVREIHWKPGHIEINGTFLDKPFRVTAARIIVTLPLGVLQATETTPGIVRFSPALQAKRSALEKLAAGPVIKACMRFASAFWETLDDERYAEASFFHAAGAKFPTFWTALPWRVPMLVAWAGGPRAAHLSNRSPEEVIDEAVASLDTVFGLKRSRRGGSKAQLQDTWHHDWQADPYARGAYSYVVAGGESARAQLAKPIDGTLFFAGEATDTKGEAGTVAGALQSGKRAARELIKASGKSAR